MNEPDVSHEPVWSAAKWNRTWQYLYTIDRVDYYVCEGHYRAKFSDGLGTWTEIEEKDHTIYGEDWDRAPQSARDHLTALAALHR